MWIATFRLHTATCSVHQAMRTTGYTKPYKALCSMVVVPVGCSLSGPLFRSSPVVVFFDRGHRRFWNSNSTIPVDVVRVKSYVNRLSDPASVPMRITITKLFIIPKRIVSGVVGVF